MVLSTETFNQSIRTEYSEAVNARYTFQPLWVSCVTYCIRLHTLLHLLACCCTEFARNWSNVQQLPTFLLFLDHRSVAQQCYIRLHSPSNVVGSTHAQYICPSWRKQRINMLKTRWQPNFDNQALFYSGFRDECINVREYELREPMFHTWPSTNDNFFQSHFSTGSRGHLLIECMPIGPSRITSCSARFLLTGLTF